VEQEGAQSGQYYVTIENREARDARYLQEVTVSPNSYYKLSGWIKTENVGNDVLEQTCLWKELLHIQKI